MITSREAQREALRKLVEQWNENRLDLFNISFPNEDLEIHGVMRFYFQESMDKVCTKCIRVSSTANTKEVVDALIEKFHTDLKMLSNPEYSLWEVHENGEERRLDDNERPLLVQLNWHKDDREGRFLLRQHPIPSPYTTFGVHNDSFDVIQRGTRTFSKRAKKELKKKHQQNALMMPQETLAQQLYKALPPTNFTRTISNPEIVMKKRREKKIEARLKDLGQGGSLKIYGYDLDPNRPYVTLLVSIRDSAYKIVKETLEKYGLEKENCNEYVLVEVKLPMSNKVSRSLSDLRDMNEIKKSERYMNSDECPLMCLANHTGDLRNEILFAVRKRINYPHSSQLLERMPCPQISSEISNYANPARLSFNEMHLNVNRPMVLNPCIAPLPLGATASTSSPLRIEPFITDVGSDRSMRIHLAGETIRPRHAVITFEDGIVAITPSVSSAEIEVNDQRIYQTTTLQNRDTISLGGIYFYRYYNSIDEALAVMGRNYALQPSRKFQEQQSLSMDFHMPSNHPLRESSSVNIDRERARASTIPAFLEVYENVEDEFIRSVISDETERIQFKLSPTFIIYMVARHRLYIYQNSYLSDQLINDKIRFFISKIAERCQVTVKENDTNKESLAFWLANCSELLNILKTDNELSNATVGKPQDIFIDCINFSFNALSSCLKERVLITLNHFINTQIDDLSAASETVGALEEIMRLLRKCRLNAALTIQLFSQIFHFINANLFNWLVSPRASQYCSTAFGIRIQRRLSVVHDWAEQQGLELAAECHMDRIQQAINLLVTPKTVEHMTNLGATCYKLNSIQVRWLLEHMVLDVGEEPISHQLISSVVRVAETQADVMAVQDGLTVQLEEPLDLHLPFLIPQDGYSQDILRGVPPSMTDYICVLQRRGLCRLLPHINSSGSWTIHSKDMKATGFNIQEPGEVHRQKLNIGSGRTELENNLCRPLGSSTQPTILLSRNMYGDDENLKRGVQQTNIEYGNNPHIVNISFNRGNGGIGLSIVAAQGIGEKSVGIYVKKVVEDGAAYKDGRLECGDQLLAVNGQSLFGISQEEAATKMASAGPFVSFDVKKYAARHNGLSECFGASPSLKMPVHILSNQNYSFTPDQDSLSSWQHPSSFGNAQFDRRMDVNNEYFSNQSLKGNDYVNLHVGRAENRANNLLYQGYNSNIPTLNLKTRSASASELYFNQEMDVSSTPSLISLPHPKPNDFNNPLQTRQRETNRPIVIQPLRPSVSPRGPRRMERNPPNQYYPPTTSTSHLFPTSNTTRATNDSASPLVDYANLPLIEKSEYQLNSYGMSHHNVQDRVSTLSPYQNVSNSHDDVIATSNNYMDSVHSYAVNRHQQNTPPVHAKSGSLSQRRDELNRELERLERKGTAMSDDERNLFRRYVNELTRIREPLTANVSVSGTTNVIRSHNVSPNLVPPTHYISHAEQLRMNLSPPVVILKRFFSGDRKPKGLEVVMKETPIERRVDMLINAVQEQMEELDVHTPSEANKDDHSSPVAQPTKVVKRNDETKVAGAMLEDKSAEDEDLNEPRVLVLGKNEVYRDPRQQRLNEIQAKQTAKKFQVDGANLGFRDKMKLFAEQIGERAPQPKIKTSSAQREIEQVDHAS